MKKTLPILLFFFFAAGPSLYAVDEWQHDTISYVSYEDRVSYTGLTTGPDNTYHKVFVRVYFDYENPDEERIPFDIYYTCKEPGEAWSEPELLGEEDLHENEANIVVADDGSVYVAFRRKNEEVDYWSDKIVVAEKTEDGWVYEEIPTICNTVNWYPELAADADGNLHLTWVSLEEGQYYEDYNKDYRIAYSTNLSGEWETQLLADSELGEFGLGAYPTLDVSADGVAHILYRGGNYGPGKQKQSMEPFGSGQHKLLTSANVKPTNDTCKRSEEGGETDHSREHPLNRYRMHYATNLNPGGTYWEIDILESEKYYDEMGNIFYDDENSRVHVVTGGSNGHNALNYVYYFSREYPSGAWSDPVQVNHAGFGNPINLFQGADKRLFAAYMGVSGQFGNGKVYISELRNGEFIDQEIYSDYYLARFTLMADKFGEILFPHSDIRILETDDEGNPTNFTMDLFMQRSGEHLAYNPTAVQPEPELMDFSVFPNPAESKINIRIQPSSSCQASLMMTDLQGRPVMAEKQLDLSSGGSEFSFSIDSLHPGFYLLVVQNETFTQTKKILVR